MEISVVHKKTIVVLIALAEEFETFGSVFPHKGDLSRGLLVCLEHEIEIPGFRLISVLAEQMGSQSAANSADVAIKEFNPDLVIVLGIAGGISSDVSIGDVCVSNEIIDVLHNNKISESGGITEISFAPDFYNVDAELVSSFAFLRVHPDLKNGYRGWQEISLESAQALNLDNVVNTETQLHIGPIACGPVSSSKQFNEKLKNLHRKVTAIETESGGVFQRVISAKIPVTAIRGISDLADSDKASLEARTKGAARKLAMLNACTLLRIQLASSRFLDVATRYAVTKSEGQAQLFDAPAPSGSVIAELERETKERLKELSTEFRARPDGFYLPTPRARKISYEDELSGRDLDEPENIIDCLRQHDRIVVRLPRTFPSQALGWSLAYSLLRQQIEGKVVLPFVVNGTAIKPPRAGLMEAIPAHLRKGSEGSECLPVFIIEEPCFESRSRLRFLSSELAGTSAKVMILTKSEDNISAVEEFVTENGLTEFELAPVSFAETAFFLEQAFDMAPREAEAVAIRLDDTFRRFRLDAHPTYFAGLQEETLAALINANKRAELIQLAVDGLLTLIVAADRSKPNLSRTTRERFLRRLVVEMATSGKCVDDDQLNEMAGAFLKEYAFDLSRSEFLNPFFQIGLLYQSAGAIYFTHPYLESYLLAQALREQPDLARTYFDPARSAFNYYAYDLYCEMGPDAEVIAAMRKFAEQVAAAAAEAYPGQHVYTDTTKRLATLSTPAQLASLTKGLVATAQKLERDDSDENVRVEKQRILDTKRHVRSEVGSRNPARDQDLPGDVKREFEILDGLSRALSLCTTGIGSGSEALSGDAKTELAELVLELASRFSDIWTRNRLRIDFEQARAELLNEDHIWKYLSETGADESQFGAVKAEIELALYGAELNTILDPMGRVLWRISSTAGVKVLAPVLEAAESKDSVQRIIRACWFMDVDPAKGRDMLKSALSDYKGSALLRMVLASHLLWRVFWHHYKTAGSGHFIASAKRALAPIGLIPAPNRVEQVSKGPHG